MKIHQGSQTFEKLNSAVVTMGTFDGVHRGHQRLLQLLRTKAQEIDSETVLLTFWPHPRLMLTHTHTAPIQLLTPSLEEKAALLAQHGIDHLVVIPFTQDFAQLSAQDFIQQVLIAQLGMKHILVGHDHRFGKGRAGDVALLQELGHHKGFAVTEVAPVLFDNVVVSSTKIRQLLLTGDIEQANTYLGRPYSIKCTAWQTNTSAKEGMLLTPSGAHQLIPADGLYQVQVIYQEATYSGTLRITSTPTFTLELKLPSLSSAAMHGDSLNIVFTLQ